MTEQIVIRRGIGNDAPDVARIHLAARRAAMPWLREVHSEAETYEWAATILPAENEIWAAEADGQVVAFAAVAPGWLNHLYVEPQWQGRGIGRRLLDLARERNPDELLLWTFARNERARRFYENAGFVAVEETDGAGNEEQEPDVLYRWRPEATASQ